MSTIQILDSVFDPDIRTVHYFNGRLLSAEDLSSEQQANQSERRRLGRAIGDGIARGLEVFRKPGADPRLSPTLTVNAGLAIDRRGQTLSLSNPVDIVLTEATSGVGTVSGAGDTSIATFEMCMPSEAGPYVAGAGMYVLSIGAVGGRQGRAMAGGLGNIEASCNTKYDVPGVRFRLIPLTIPEDYLDQPALLRNRFAYECLVGKDPVDTAFYQDVFGPPVTSYGIVDDLRPTLLKNCEIPLALVYLTADNGLEWVDMWSVRRRVVASPAASYFPLLTSDRRLAEAEAMFMQFQDQLETLRVDTADPSELVATDHYRYLPPFGIVPLRSARWPIGFDEDAFFDGITTSEPIFIEGARLTALLHSAFQYPRLELDSRVMLWRYKIRENAQAIDENPSTAPQPYIVFASGHMPYVGDAHYDVNRWFYSHFS